jgi:hypothetical protein
VGDLWRKNFLFRENGVFACCLGTLFEVRVRPFVALGIDKGRQGRSWCPFGLVWSVVGLSRYELKELGFEFVLGDVWFLLPRVYRYAVRMAL